jgi:hypothetical protein
MMMLLPPPPRGNAKRRRGRIRLLRLPERRHVG